MSHDVFVSYSTKDKVVADALVAALESKNIRCWYAPRDISPGMDWGRSITRAIDQCTVVLLIFSSHANQSQRVLDEIYYAISEEKAILPFRIENLDPTDAMRLHLASRHWLDAYQPNWQAHIDRLTNSLTAFLEKAVISVAVEERMKAPAISPADSTSRSTLKKKPGFLWIGVLAIPLLALLVWGLIPDSLLQNGISNLIDDPTTTQRITEVQTGTRLPTETFSPTATAMVTPTPNALEHYEAFASPILEMLTHVGPDFTDDFSSQRPEWGKLPPGIEISDGVLRTNGKQSELNFSGLWPQDEFPQNYALQFEFEMEEYVQNLPFEINFHTSADGSYNITHQNLSGLNYWIARLVTNNKQRFDNIGLERAYLRINDYALVTFIVQRSESILILQGWDTDPVSESVFYINNDSISNGELSILFNSRETVPIKIDNLKFWELEKDYLEGFIKPIMNLIESNPPDYEDDFSTLNPDWQTAPSVYVADGDLVMETIDDYLGGQLIQGCDFAVELTLKVIYEQYDPNMIYLFQLRGVEEGSGGYNFDIDFQPGDDLLSWQISTEGDVINYAGLTTAYHSQDFNQFLFLAQENRFAVFLNDELLYYFEDETYTDCWNKLLLSTWEQEVTLLLTQLRFWNLGPGTLE